MEDRFVHTGESQFESETTLIYSGAGGARLAQTERLRPEPAGRVSVAQRAHHLRHGVVRAHRAGGHPAAAARAEDVAAPGGGEDAGEDGESGVVVGAGEGDQLVTTDHSGAE